MQFTSEYITSVIYEIGSKGVSFVYLFAWFDINDKCNQEIKEEFPYKTHAFVRLPLLVWGTTLYVIGNIMSNIMFT